MAEQIEVVGRGPRGPKGWTPVFLSLTDGARKLVRITGWAGGAGEMPATGFLGDAGVVSDAADATDFAPRGLLSVEQDEDANLVLHYNDDTSQTIAAYFADVLAKAQDVAEKYDDFVPKQEDFVQKYDDFVPKQEDFVEKYADFAPKQQDFVEKYDDFVPKQQDFVEKYEEIVTLHGDVDGSAQAVEISRGLILGWFTAISGWFPSIQSMYNTISGWYAQMGDWYVQTGTNAASAANSATQATASAASAANLVLGVATNRPSVRPSLLLDFANSRAVDPRISFTRNSIATYFDAQGVMRTAQANQPRITFDPATGKCLGLLIEESRTNLFLYAEDFANAAWIKARSIVTNEPLKNPRRSNSEKLVWDGNVGVAYVYQSRSVTIGQPYTLSFLVRAGEANQVQVSFYDTNTAFATGGTIFNIAAKSVVSTSGGVINHPIQDCGDGWIRISVTATATATSANANVSVGLNVSTQVINQGIYLAAAQLEAGAFPTSHIPTTTAAVTRQADVAQITGTAFSEFYNASEGGLYFEGSGGAAQSAGAVGVSLYGDTSNYIYTAQRNATNAIRGLVVRSANTEVVAHTAALPLTASRFALGYKKDNYASSIDGGVVHTDSSGDLPVGITALVIGALIATNNWNGTIACIGYWPKRLSNTEIQVLTGSGLLSGKNSNQLPTAGDLGSAAFSSIPSLLMRPSRQEFQVEGTGAIRTITVRRPYDFAFAIVDATGSTVTAQPLAASVANTAYSLTFNAPVGTILTYSITPIFYA